LPLDNGSAGCDDPMAGALAAPAGWLREPPSPRVDASLAAAASAMAAGCPAPAHVALAAHDSGSQPLVPNDNIRLVRAQAGSVDGALAMNVEWGMSDTNTTVGATGVSLARSEESSDGRGRHDRCTNGRM
jgi:hypothetical protein